MRSIVAHVGSRLHTCHFSLFKVPEQKLLTEVWYSVAYIIKYSVVDVELTIVRLAFDGSQLFGIQLSEEVLQFYFNLHI